MRPKRSSPVTHPSSPIAFKWPVRVYYEDTDLGGIVYYANYLKFMERARTEWLRALGFEQTALARDHGVVFVVSSLAIDYLRPAAFNDELVVTVELETLGAAQIVVRQTVARAVEALATASVRIGCVNTATFRPVRIPKLILAKLGNRT
jgi:acyl-CoA thioester hydrolase